MGAPPHVVPLALLPKVRLVRAAAWSNDTDQCGRFRAQTVAVGYQSRQQKIRTRRQENDPRSSLSLSSCLSSSNPLFLVVVRALPGMENAASKPSDDALPGAVGRAAHPMRGPVRRITCRVVVSDLWCFRDHTGVDSLSYQSFEEALCMRLVYANPDQSIVRSTVHLL